MTPGPVSDSLQMMPAPPPNSALLLLCALLLCGGRVCGGVVISEVMADNASVLEDADGDHSDWVELHNPDASAADLTGYTLTDDPLQPAKWTFPSVLLPSGGHLVVFCSGKNRAAAGQELHTGFRLDKDGEYLALHAPGGAVPVFSFQPAFPPLPEDISCGPATSTPDAPVVLFSVPTPGAANSPASASAESVAFSTRSRTFTGSLQVALTVTSPAASVRYTLDGSLPGPGALLYTSPLTLTSCTTLRAMALEPGRPDGPVRTEIYYALDAAAAAFTSPLPLVVTHGNDALPLTGERLPATIMIFQPAAPGGLASLSDPPALVSRCSLARRGNSTLNASKYSMDLEFTAESGGDRALSPAGLPADADWVLHAAWEHDPSLLRDDLIFQLSRDAGRYAPRPAHVELFHAGTQPVITWQPGAAPYAGVYSLMEKIKRGADRVPVEALSPAENTEPEISGGYILKIDRLDPGDAGIQAGGYTFGLVYPKENATDPKKMATPAQKAWLAGWLNDCSSALQSSGFTDPDTGYAAFIDPPSFADHHLFSVLAKNVDAFRQSEFFHKPRNERLISGPLWDFDRSMGSTDGRDIDPLTWRGTAGDGGTNYFHHGYYDRLFNDPVFWQLWVDRLGELRRGALSTGHVHAAVDALAARLSPGGLNAPGTPVERNFQRWPTRPPRSAGAATPGTDGTWAGEIAWLKHWWAQRLTFADSQFTVAPALTVLPGPVPSFVLSSPSLQRPGAKIYFTTNGTDPWELPPDSARVLLREDDAFTATVATPAIGTAWRGADLNADGNNGNDFDDSAWSHSSPSAKPWQNPGERLNGAGYDDSSSGLSVNYLPYINIRWGTPANPVPGNPVMRGVTNSCYLRYRFHLSPGELSQLVSLRLRARYDDGFVAFLNGTEVLRVNQPAGAPAQTGFPPQPPTPLSWNSSAGALHTDADAVNYDSGTFGITAALQLLHTGENMLAIHGLNVATGSPDTNSSDFLFQCQLEGGRSPEADDGGFRLGTREYTGPVTMDTGSPVLVIARTLDPATPLDPAQAGVGIAPVGTGWSPPISVWLHPGAVPASAANLRIAEIHYHPAPVSAREAELGFRDPGDFEFLRLENFSTQPVDLTGITFTQGISFRAESAKANWLPAGGSALIVKNLDGYEWRCGSDNRVIGTFSGDLADTGERILLLAANGGVIADFTWGSTAPWPVCPAGSGPSLCWRAGPPADGSSWTPSADPGGVPLDFGCWLQRYFPGLPGGDPSGALDPDGDGLSNLAEFALGLNPARPDAVQMTAAPPQAGVFSMNARRRRNAADVTWTFQVSGPAGTWLDGGPPQTTIDHGDGTETATWSTPATAPGLFVRLKISVP